MNLAPMIALIPTLLGGSGGQRTAIKPVAVLIHGAGGGGWEYRSWEPVLRKLGYQVIAKDLMPAKGGLAKTTLSDYVFQVESSILKQRGKTLLVGASLGGGIALEVAKRVRVDGVVLVNSVLPKGIADPKWSRDIPDVLKWANGPYRETVEAMPDSDEPTRKFAWKRWRDESGAVMRAVRGGRTYQRPRCPVLFVVSRKDTNIPPDLTMKWATQWGADSMVYGNMSHVGPLLGKRSLEVAEMVGRWFLSKGNR